MKILVISLAGVGDTLMATPLLCELKKNFPDSTINVLVMWKSSKRILDNNPHIDKIYQFDMIKKGLFKTILFCNKLKKEKYDISINVFPQGKIHYRIISRLINAKLRLSHQYNKFLLENFLINRFINPDYNLHCIENNLNLLRILNKKEKLGTHDYELYFSEKNLKFAEEFIQKNNLKNKRIIGFHIGSGSSNKIDKGKLPFQENLKSVEKNLIFRRWPIKNYIKLAEKLLNLDKKIVIMLFGAGEEEKENEKIASINTKRMFIVGSDDIIDSAALIKKCNIFLSVDTSLMHIASAVRVKNQLVIETPTFNKTVYPYSKKFTLIKNHSIKKDILGYYKYDGKPIRAKESEIKKMMESVGIDEVYENIRKLLPKNIKNN